MHFAAALRRLLAATQSKVAEISAFTTLLQTKLAPVDTIHAILRTDNKVCGTFDVSFGTEYKAGFSIEVVTTNGRVSVGPTEVVVADASGVKASPIELNPGVAEELDVFVTGIINGQLDERLSLEEAVEDLNLVESMLQSASSGHVINVLLER